MVAERFFKRMRDQQLSKDRRFLYFGVVWCGVAWSLSDAVTYYSIGSVVHSGKREYSYSFILTFVNLLYRIFREGKFQVSNIYLYLGRYFYYELISLL